MELTREILMTVANATILFFDAIGVLVMIALGVRAIIDLFRHSPDLRRRLGRGMGTALQFLMGGEILRTVVTEHELESVVVIGALVLIRAALSLMLHWETSNEEHTSKGKAPAKEEDKEHQLVNFK